jgi:hypothetical protein
VITEHNTNKSFSQYITSLKINPAGNTIITGYASSLSCIVSLCCSQTIDTVVMVASSNMQVLVMGLLAYLTSVLVLQLIICRWALVLR